MSQQAQRITWPLVALAGVLAVFGLGVFLVSDPPARTMLVGLLVSSVGAIITVVVQRLAGKIDQVHQQVNGRMSTLIDAKTIRGDDDQDHWTT